MWITVAIPIGVIGKEQESGQTPTSKGNFVRGPGAVLTCMGDDTSERRNEEPESSKAKGFTKP